MCTGAQKASPLIRRPEMCIAHFFVLEEIPAQRQSNHLLEANMTGGIPQDVDSAQLESLLRDYVVLAHIGAIREVSFAGLVSCEVLAVQGQEESKLKVCMLPLRWRVPFRRLFVASHMANVLLCSPYAASCCCCSRHCPAPSVLASRAAALSWSVVLHYPGVLCCSAAASGWIPRESP